MKIIGNDLKYYYPLKTPGIFYDINIFLKSEILEFLKPYKLIEDLPMWIYFTMNRREYKCSVDLEPYVLYRNGVGVSFNLNETSPFLIELKSIQEKYKLDKVEKYGKWFNPYRYFMWLNEKKIEWYAKKCFKMNDGDYNLKKIHEEAKQYIEMITNKTNEFMKSSGSI